MYPEVMRMKRLPLLLRALGAYFGGAATLLYPPLIAARIRDEERILRDGLPGYDAYTRRVRWKMMPYIY